MKTKVRFTARRLLTALEDMAERESALLDMGALDQVLELQGRMAPLVECVSELAPEVADDDMRRTAMRLIDRRHRNHVRLGHELGKLQRDRQKARQSQSRLTRLGPAYRQNGQRSVFQAQG
jgi:hypothetical protein